MIAFHYHHNKFFIELKTKINKFISSDFHKTIYIQCKQTTIQNQDTLTQQSTFNINMKYTVRFEGYYSRKLSHRQQSRYGDA